MPTYDYECQACGAEIEIFQQMSASPKKKCPDCGKLKLKRLIGGGSGFIFKGSGFYTTDYRSEEYKAKAKAESETANSSKSSTSDAKSDAKSDTKKSKSDSSSSSTSSKSSSS